MARWALMQKLPEPGTACMPNEDIAQCRRRAEECRRRANATDDVLLKAHWLEQADTWKGLADSAERVASMGSIKPFRDKGS